MPCKELSKNLTSRLSILPKVFKIFAPKNLFIITNDNTFICPKINKLLQLLLLHNCTNHWLCCRRRLPEVMTWVAAPESSKLKLWTLTALFTRSPFHSRALFGLCCPLSPFVSILLINDKYILNQKPCALSHLWASCNKVLYLTVVYQRACGLWYLVVRHLYVKYPVVMKSDSTLLPQWRNQPSAKVQIHIVWLSKCTCFIFKAFISQAKNSSTQEKCPCNEMKHKEIWTCLD